MFDVLAARAAPSGVEIMDNLLIVLATIAAGTFLYIYVAPVFSHVTAAINNLPF